MMANEPDAEKSNGAGDQPNQSEIDKRTFELVRKVEEATRKQILRDLEARGGYNIRVDQLIWGAAVLIIVVVDLLGDFFLSHPSYIRGFFDASQNGSVACTGECDQQPPSRVDSLNEQSTAPVGQKQAPKSAPSAVIRETTGTLSSPEHGAFGAAGWTTEQAPSASVPLQASFDSTPHPFILAKWTQLVAPQDGCNDGKACEPSILVRAIVPKHTDCTRLAHSLGDRSPIEMKRRRNPDPSAFMVEVCEELLEPGHLGVAFKDGTHLTWSSELSSDGDGPKRVAIIGDTGCRVGKGQNCSTIQAWPLTKVAADAAYLDGEPPDLVIHVGDIRYRGSDRWEDWYADFFRPARPLLEAAPWVIARGNHDNCVERKGAGWLYFFQARLGPPSECANEPDVDPIDLQPQAFDVADDLRIVVLDSANTYYRCARWADRFELYTPKLSKLLKPSHKDVQNIETKVWLVTHYPIWHSDEPPDAACASGSPALKPMRRLLESILLTHDNRVSAILSGDIHHFQVVQPLVQLNDVDLVRGGIPLQFVAGHGGVLIGPRLGGNPKHVCTSKRIYFKKRFTADGGEQAKDQDNITHGVAICEHGLLLAERANGVSWEFTMRPAARHTAYDAAVSCTLDEPRKCIGSPDQSDRVTLDHEEDKRL